MRANHRECDETRRSAAVERCRCAGPVVNPCDAADRRERAEVGERDRERAAIRAAEHAIRRRGTAFQYGENRGRSSDGQERSAVDAAYAGRAWLPSEHDSILPGEHEHSMTRSWLSGRTTRSLVGVSRTAAPQPGRRALLFSQGCNWRAARFPTAVATRRRSLRGRKVRCRTEVSAGIA